jgi:UMF1 family MFS transporter
LAVSNLVVMLTMPALGAFADMSGGKKRLLAVTTLGCVIATAALAWAGPGDLALGVAALIVSNVLYTYGESLIASYLPELARPSAVGRVSGWGWSFGYVGGMLSLGLSLAYVLHAQSQGQSASQFVPVTMLLTAGVYGAASLVTFMGLMDRPAGNLPSGSAPSAREAWVRMWHTLREVARYQDFAWLLACTVAYQAGISVVIALAAVYAEQALGFSQVQTMTLVFLVNIAATVGAFGFGHWQDRIGHRRALSLTLVGWVVMSLMAGLAQSTTTFWVSAMLAGICMGSSQSAGRAMVALLAPDAQRAEFFGLWTFAVRLSAIIGPMTYGLVTWWSAGNHRLGILSTGLFFVLGLILLGRINLVRGQTASGATLSH